MSPRSITAGGALLVVLLGVGCAERTVLSRHERPARDGGLEPPASSKGSASPQTPLLARSKPSAAAAARTAAPRAGTGRKITAAVLGAWLGAAQVGALDSDHHTAQLRGYFDAEPSLKDIFTNLDRNRDNRVSLQEFMDNALEATQLESDIPIDPVMMDWFEGVFLASDLNDDGFLDMDEAGIMNRLTQSAFHASVDRLQTVLTEVLDVTGTDIDIHSVVSLLLHLTAHVHGRSDIQELMRKAFDVIQQEQLSSLMDPRFFDWLAELLHKADADYDGTLSPPEAQLMLHVAKVALEGGLHLEEEDDEFDDIDEDEDALTGTFREMDANRDGRIDKVEFINKSLDIDPSGRGLYRARQMFEMADLNSDYSLDREELGRLLKHEYGR